MPDKSKSNGHSSLSGRIKAIASRDPPQPDGYGAVNAKKRSTRSPAYKPAVLVLRGGEKLAVIIKNLSATGAKVEYYRKMELPARVRLIEQSVGLDVVADVIWQRDGVLGLTFVKT